MGASSRFGATAVTTAMQPARSASSLVLCDGQCGSNNGRLEARSQQNFVTCLGHVAARGLRARFMPCPRIDELRCRGPLCVGCGWGKWSLPSATHDAPQPELPQAGAQRHSTRPCTGQLQFPEGTSTPGRVLSRCPTTPSNLDLASQLASFCGPCRSHPVSHLP